MEKTKLTFKEIVEHFKREDKKRKRINGEIKPTENFIKLEDLVCQQCSAEQVYRIAELNLQSTDIQKLARVIINSQNPWWNYCFAKVKGADVKEHRQVIINSKDPKLNYYFANDFKGSEEEIKAHREVVIKSKNPEWNFYFAMTIKSSEEEIKAHREVVIKSKNPEWNLKFIKVNSSDLSDIKAHAVIGIKSDCDIIRVANALKGYKFDVLEEAIIESNNPGLICYFAENIENANTTALGNAIVKSKNFNWFREFLKKVKNAESKTFSKVIIDSKDPAWNYLFVKEFVEPELYGWGFIGQWYWMDTDKGIIKYPKDTIKDCRHVVIDSQDPYWNYKFATEIESSGEEIRAHRDVVIKSQNPRCNFEFARYNYSSVEEIKAHRQAVIDSKDPKWNSYFAKEIRSSEEEIKAHRQVVIDSKDPEWNCYFAKEIKSSEEEIKAHRQAVIDSKDPEGNLEFISYINSSDDERKAHARVFFDSKDFRYYFHWQWCWKDLNLSKDEIREFGEAVIASGDPEANYYFAKDFGSKGADREAHRDVVLASRNPYWNCLFANHVKPCNKLSKHQSIIYYASGTKNFFDICTFIMKFASEGIDIYDGISLAWRLFGKRENRKIEEFKKFCEKLKTKHGIIVTFIEGPNRLPAGVRVSILPKCNFDNIEIVDIEDE